MPSILCLFLFYFVLKINGFTGCASELPATYRCSTFQGQVLSFSTFLRVAFCAGVPAPQASMAVVQQRPSQPQSPLRDLFASFSHAQLSVRPTPLHRLTRLSDALGSSCGLWVKREDLTGFGLGGNKVATSQRCLSQSRTSYRILGPQAGLSLG